MKKIFALALVLASAQASAFYDSSNGSYMNNYGSNGDMVGNGSGEGEATFSMDFSGKTKQSRNVQMNGTSAGNMNNFYGYDQPAYGQMPAPVQSAR